MTIEELQIEGLSAGIRDAEDLTVQALGRWVATPTLRAAMMSLLRTREPEIAVHAVPLLVHAAEAGTTQPAIPVAATHHLWWLAAHVMDDVIDAGDLTYEGTVTSGEAVMAAVACGAALPVELLADQYPADLALTLTRQFLESWIFSNDGQLMDLTRFDDLDHSVDLCDQAMLMYHHKNGAAYGMACSMAATVAGAPPERVDLWRQWGFSAATIGQFRNDQEDLVTGRDEDIRNNTPTYLLATYFSNLPNDQARSRTRQLLIEARDSPNAVMEVRARLLSPENVLRYFEKIDSLKNENLQMLEALHAPPTVEAPLRQLVFDAAAPVHGFVGLRC